jgi:CTP synthase
MRFIVITGGVVSGLGKGITASSVALILKSMGHVVTAIKIDPYLNIDAGTMSPFEHGECYVLEDGGEVDLDLGNYERFLNINFTKDHNITTGKIYQRVIQKERDGAYLGKTVQIIPHITNEIQEWIHRVAHIPIEGRIPEFCIIEMGGTVGDMETGPFIEAIRQMSMNDDAYEFCFVHVSLLIENGGELKTKPTQQSTATLRTLGITPNLLILRSPTEPPHDLIHKLSIQCHIPIRNIIINTNVPSIYYVPHVFLKQGIDVKLYDRFGLQCPESRPFCYDSYYGLLAHFDAAVNTSDAESGAIRISIAGKYVNMPDTYLSIIRAIDHASIRLGVRTTIQWIDSDSAEISIDRTTTDAVIIPGGFGSRGIEGKIEVARQCREKGIPVLGICLGMQVMVVELFRANGFPDAASTEWMPTTSVPVIDSIPGQDGKMGGTMRLGNYTTTIRPDTCTAYCYNSAHTTERHRHRYEFNHAYCKQMEEYGMVVSGFNEEDSLVEIVEISNHPFYIGCQFHPEYSSKNERPHPLFVGLLRSVIMKDIVQ